ncbi:hypothetical protein NQ317_001023 [Molorchus minor]|uniref:Uncharacterized protein n=1 Tax=Molorchus minor TaxID=1323400 RepID=A0ABQ9JKD5_9CUCU|nr:hypothetical protein NQ317_001023 [Molorchus minor]
MATLMRVHPHLHVLTVQSSTSGVPNLYSARLTLTMTGKYSKEDIQKALRQSIMEWGLEKLPKWPVTPQRRGKRQTEGDHLCNFDRMEKNKN